MSELGSSERVGGVVLIAVSAISLFAMAHHPVIDSADANAILDEIRREAPLNRWVHGSMIAFALIYFWGFQALCRRLSDFPNAVSAGNIAAGVATTTMLGAALISGFITPDIAWELDASGLASQPGRLDFELASLHSANQWLAELGTISYGVAILAWSICLLRLKGANRVIGGIGVAAGLAITGGLLFGLLRLSVSGMTLVVAVLALWSTAVGVQMARRQL